MKGKARKTVVAGFCLLGLLGTASLSWGITLTTENNPGFFTLTTPGVVTYGTNTTLYEGSVYAPGAYGVPVPGNPLLPGPGSVLQYSETITGAGNLGSSFVDGSISGSGPVYSNINGLGNGTFAELNGYAQPVAILDGNVDNNVLSSTTVGSLLGGSVMATDHTLYHQDFSLALANKGNVSFAATNYVSFMLGLLPGEVKPYVDANAYYATGIKLFLTNTKNGQDFVETDYTFDVLNVPDGITDLTQSLGKTLFGIGAGTYNGYIEVETWTTSQVSSVPEPGTFVLVGAGLFGFAIWRRRKA